MGDTEYSYELTVNIVAEMVLDYMSKNTNMDKDILRKTILRPAVIKKIVMKKISKTNP